MAFVQKNTIIVPDISFYSGITNFTVMKAGGAQGVIIRAGQQSYADSKFAEYWAAAKGILLRGCYWFYDSRAEPLGQAALFVSLIKDNLPEMEVWLDYEESYGGAWSGWRHFAVFVAEVKRLLPSARIGIYTGYYYWRDHSPDPTTEAASFQWFKQFSLWLAWYSDASVVKIPAPWASALYWQFTPVGNGPAYGTEALGLDLSCFQGTQAEFDLRYGVTTPPPPPPPVTVV